MDNYITIYMKCSPEILFLFNCINVQNTSSCRHTVGHKSNLKSQVSIKNVCFLFFSISGSNIKVGLDENVHQLVGLNGYGFHFFKPKKTN